MPPLRSIAVAVGIAASLASLTGCAAKAPSPSRPTGHRAVTRAQAAAEIPSAAAAIASRQIGTPYRFGGRSPAGFDCSGLVLYSYAGAGLSGLPHSAAALERHARAVRLSELAPGDLLFFSLEGTKTSHVAIYLGDRTFVHAPSPGRAVETVRFDHVYWGPRIRRAGRLAD